MSLALDTPVERLAVAAWRKLSPGASEPDAIVTLKDRGATGSVRRLCGAGPGGADIVAKRTDLRKAAVEQAVYEQVLPALGLRAAGFYGAVPEDDSELCWLFLEDIRGKPLGKEHRALAAEWLAALHVAASALPAPAGLPRKDLAYYREIVQTTQRQIDETLDRDGLDAEQRAWLERTLEELEYLDTFWSDLAELCAAVPETVVHGDFAAKNLVVAEDATIVALDWGSAAWGTTAIDLPHVDAGPYRAAISARGPDLSLEAIERAAAGGRVLQAVAMLRGVAAGLPAPSIVRKLKHRGRKVADALGAAGWG